MSLPKRVAIKSKTLLLLPVTLRIGAVMGQGPALSGMAFLGVLPALAVPLWLGRRLGGHTGDSYGACVEWGETLVLLLGASAYLLLSGVG